MHGGASAVDAGWSRILLVFAHGAVAIAGLAVLPPMIPDLIRAFGISAPTAGLLVSAFFVPAALGSTVGGWIMDRTGARPALLIGCACFLLADMGCYLAPNLGLMLLARVLAGAGFVAFVNAAPAILIATTSGRRRGAAMSLWSTFTPAGWLIGFALASLGAGTSGWRLLFIYHGLLVLALALAHPLTPRTAAIPRSPTAAGAAALFAIYQRPATLRLALAFAASVLAGLGMSTVLPLQFIQRLATPAGAASALLSLSFLPTLMGGLFVGWLLSRERKARSILIGAVILGLLTAPLIFLPSSGFPLATAATMAWQFTIGMVTAVVMSRLPHVAPLSETGAAAGLLTQASGLSALIGAPVFLSLFAGGAWLILAGVFEVLYLAVLIVAPLGVVRAAPNGAEAI